MSRGEASVAAIVLAIELSGGAPVGPDFERPAAIVSPQFKEIAGWKVATPRQSELKGEWWSVFHNAELSRLESAVAISNQTVKADEANYREALALINEARAGLFPTINGNGSAVHSSPNVTTLTAEATGQWMLDVWGLVRREIEAEQAGAEGVAANLANALLAAQSALALAYVQLREADSLETLLTRTVEDYKHSLQIATNQYNAGTAAKSDVITAEAQVLNAQAALIAAGVSRAQSEHAIAVLMGRPPAGLSIPRGLLASGIPSIPVGLPSSLLERRPDVAAAEETMRQANVEIGVAFAGYFPAISLSGLFGYSGDPWIRQIGAANPVWSFGASLAQPLFNGGLTGAQVEAARETYQSDVATYRQTVLTAIQQVEDNLAGIRILSREATVQAEDVRISRQATQIAINEYQAGTQAYTAVVTAEQQQLAAEEAQLSTRAQIQTGRGQPHRRARWRLEPVEAARRGGGFLAAQPSSRKPMMTTSAGAGTIEPTESHVGKTSPERSGLVLAALILAAAVANLNLAVANVALPSIGAAFDTSQTTLDLVAVGYSLGLAASVLYLGALGDRYGRKTMLVLGVMVSAPACVAAAFAPNAWVLVAARFVGGVAAGMAFPTTLALIAALWSGPARTKSIAIWSGAGGAIASLGPLTSGWLLERFWWGSVFLITLPLAAVALAMALAFVPSHVNETSDPVDNLGGVLSVLFVAALVMAINLAATPDGGAPTLGLATVAFAAGTAFIVRQRRARAPLYDLHVAARRIFWVAATAGSIVFGALMGAMFVGQQFLQNVLGYSTLEAGLAILPAAIFMVLTAPFSARLVNARGARFTLLTGYAFCLLGFLAMLVLWKEGVAYWKVALGYAFIGVGVGFAGTPASHSLTGSVPVDRAGMASGTADLQRDLGGAVMQSIFGALLTAGYGAAFGAAIANASGSDKRLLTDSIVHQLLKSFAGAADIAVRYPRYAGEITEAAKSAFLSGDQLAYIAGILAIVLGAALVFFLFPGKDEEERLLAQYHSADISRSN